MKERGMIFNSEMVRQILAGILCDQHVDNVDDCRLGRVSTANFYNVFLCVCDRNEK